MDEYPSIGIDCQGLEVPVAPVKRLFMLIVCSLWALLACSCWNGRVLLAFEEPFWASLGDDLPARLAVARESVPRGYLPRVMLTRAPDDPLARLERALTTGAYRTAVVGPLASSQWRAFVPQFARTRFILVGDIDAAGLPINAREVRYDRTGAFRSAGFAAGSTVLEEGGGDGSAALAGRVGMLLSADGVLTSEETEAFSSGVAEALDGGRPVTRMLAKPVDKPAVKAAIEQMRQSGTEILLLGTGELDPWCLEVMSSAGGSAVVADWVMSGAFPRQVFLSVEEDIPQGIGRALAAPASRQGPVAGPVRIVVGKARPVPSAAKIRLEGR
jgi:hypothetical protein